MKNTFRILSFILCTSLIITSCGGGGKSGANADAPEKEKVANKGKVLAINGEGKKDTVTYTCIGCEELLTKNATLDSIVNSIMATTKSSLYVPLSFKPKTIDIVISKKDSVVRYDNNQPIKGVMSAIGTVKYQSKNRMGVELEGDNIAQVYLVNEAIDKNIKDLMKLDSVKFEGEGDKKSINRYLELTNSDGEFIRIYPFPSKSWNVDMPFNCVDEGAWFQIKLEDNQEIKLVSYNSFNCDGDGFFYAVSKSDAEKMMKSDVSSIIVTDGENAAGFNKIPANKKDYFKQALKALKY